MLTSHNATSESLGITTENGFVAKLCVKETEITFVTNGATTNVTGFLPANSIVLSLDTRITEAPAGLGAGASLNVGDPTTVTRFGNLTVLTLDAQKLLQTPMQGGITSDAAGPVIGATALDLRVTFTGGAGSDNTPSAGKMRVALAYLDFTELTA